MVFLIFALSVVGMSTIGVSSWAFAVAVESSSLSIAVASALLFVAGALVLFLSYAMAYVAGEDAERAKRDDKARATGITLKPGQSIAFRLIPGREKWVTAIPQPIIDEGPTAPDELD